jgi:hypothetical protein
MHSQRYANLVPKSIEGRRSPCRKSLHNNWRRAGSNRQPLACKAKLRSSRNYLFSRAELRFYPCEWQLQAIASSLIFSRQNAVLVKTIDCQNGTYRLQKRGRSDRRYSYYRNHLGLRRVAKRRLQSESNRFVRPKVFAGGLRYPGWYRGSSADTLGHMHLNANLNCNSKSSRLPIAAANREFAMPSRELWAIILASRAYLLRINLQRFVP